MFKPNSCPCGVLHGALKALPAFPIAGGFSVQFPGITRLPFNTSLFTWAPHPTPSRGAWLALHITHSVPKRNQDQLSQLPHLTQNSGMEVTPNIPLLPSLSCQQLLQTVHFPLKKKNSRYPPKMLLKAPLIRPLARGHCFPPLPSPPSPL